MRRRPPALLIAAVLLLAGCGTRVDESEVRAEAQPAGPVTLDPATLEALRAASAPQAAPAGSAPTGAVAAPGPATGPLVAGAAPSSTTTNTSKPSAATPGRGGTGTVAEPSDTARCTAPGAPVNLGQVGTFSGIAGPIAGDGLVAMAVWVKDVNARGGLACHPVTLYVRDDGGDPAQAASAARELIGQRGVVAFVGNILPLSLPGFLPEIKKTCTPVIGALALDSAWATEPCLFSQGGGFEEAIAGLVRQAVARGDSKLGLLYCVEIASCGAANKGVAEAAKRDGLELVYSAQVSLTQTDFTAQCQNAKNAGVQELAVALEGSAMARLARSCLALNYKPLLVGAASAINPKQGEDPKIRELGLATINPNAPWFLTDRPGLREYQTALARYAPQILTSGITSQMWASGKLLEAGVAELGTSARQGPLTAAMVLAGLGKVRGETLGGLTAPLDFTPSHKGVRTSGCVYLAVLDTRGWTAPNGSKPLCNLLPKGTR